jgi:hypothetical protein
MRGQSVRPDFDVTHTAAWLDLGYDREFASDGVSRYGAYLRDRASWWHADDPESDPEYLAVRSAARCWEIANGPIMGPALVVLHPRILTARAAADEYDGRQLVLTVRLVVGLPDGLRRVLGYQWRSWQHEEYGPSGPTWSEPYERSGGPLRVALPTLSLSWPVPAARLPFPGGGLPDVDAAIDAVAAVAEVLNGELGPVLAHLAGQR